MSAPAWLRADPLAAILLARNEHSVQVADWVERVAILVHDAGIPELSAIESVLGYVPHSERERLADINTKPEFLHAAK